MFKIFFLLGFANFLAGQDIPHRIYPKDYQSGIIRVAPLYHNTSGTLKFQEECCTSSCCEECDPSLIVTAEDPPYYGTVHALPGIILAKDKSDLKKMKPTGRKRVSMWMGSNFRKTKATTFQAKFRSGLTMTVAVHSRFKKKLPVQYTRLFAKIIGRVPALFRKNLKHLHLIPGKLGQDSCSAWGNVDGTVTLCVADGKDMNKKGTIEELFIHEGAHTSLDPEISDDAAGYACAMNKDQDFISIYARDNPYTEDVAESVVVWYAARYRANRLDEATKDMIEAAIPHRLEYFDSRYAGQM